MSEIQTFGFWTFWKWFGRQTVPILDVFYDPLYNQKTNIFVRISDVFERLITKHEKVWLLACAEIWKFSFRHSAVRMYIKYPNIIPDFNMKQVFFHIKWSRLISQNHIFCPDFRHQDRALKTKLFSFIECLKSIHTF